MSIWTSRAAPALALLLSACVAVGGGATAIPVLGGAVTVAVPPGYCIDPKASHSDAGSALVVAGRCAADRPVPAAAITVSVGGEGSSGVLQAGAKALSDWARSPAGRAAFARDGRAASVIVRETLVADGAFLIRLEDRAIGPYWRAAIGVKGRLVMISVSPPPQGGLIPEQGRGILGKAISAVRQANAAGP